ncbi:hypothetical protein AK830_g4476 [Neonectria ditissima]|uniref:Uncharacterized protein n=1 Tax=Neonectria ditissima TaxID=78410 RepID=A0A0P7BL92_9HYPO|nr:hypothetical protein AK830_g4476 [Neonectria ditissima]
MRNQDISSATVATLEMIALLGTLTYFTNPSVTLMATVQSMAQSRSRMSSLRRHDNTSRAKTLPFMSQLPKRINQSRGNGLTGHLHEALVRYNRFAVLDELRAPLRLQRCDLVLGQDEAAAGLLPHTETAIIDSNYIALQQGRQCGVPHPGVTEFNYNR